MRDHDRAGRGAIAGLDAHHPRQGAAAAAVPRLPARARPPADRGHPGRRQDHARARARAQRSASPTSASSSPATCCPPTSSACRCSSRESGQFRFHRGPVFAQLVLADEVNRATPKAQSALLEAMEEHQVTADGQTYPLPEPFFVIATQNPLYQVGTFPLPESQLDRFLMRIELGYPDAALERQLLLGRDRRDLLATLEPAARRRSSCCGCRARCRACTRPTRCSTTCRRSRATRAQAADFEAGPVAARRHRAAARRAGVGADARPRRACCRRTCRPCWPAVVGPSPRAARRRRGSAARREVGQHVLEAVPVP